MYGPLNPAEPNEEYWSAIADEWKVDTETAKKQVCGNCAVFIQTPEMLNCIATGLTGEQNDEYDSIQAAGDLGYCEAFDFKCASARTCRAWVAGGPVTAAIDIVGQIEPMTAASDPCWDGYKQVGMKKNKDGKMVPNCVPVDAADDSDSEFAAKKKRTISQTPAPKKDRIKGSSKNKKGSASGSRKINFSASVEKSLREKVAKHNEKASKGRRATLGMLKAVYRRGAGAYSVSHRPGMTRNQWAMGRVNAFLRLLKSGKPANSAYKSDNDLLPAAHPRSTNMESSMKMPQESGQDIHHQQKMMSKESESSALHVFYTWVTANAESSTLRSRTKVSVVSRLFQMASLMLEFSKVRSSETTFNQNKNSKN
jgi:hypothetical protein